MIAFKLQTTAELLQHIAQEARARRLALNLTQKGLAVRSGVSLASIRRFETTGAIAFESLLKIAQVLDAVPALAQAFAPPEFETLDEIITQPKIRQRGRVS